MVEGGLSHVEEVGGDLLAQRGEHNSLEQRPSPVSGRTDAPWGPATGNQRTRKTQVCRGLGSGQGSEGSQVAKSRAFGWWQLLLVPTAPTVWGKGKQLEL